MLPTRLACTLPAPAPAPPLPGLLAPPVTEPAGCGGAPDMLPMRDAAAEFAAVLPATPAAPLYGRPLSLWKRLPETLPARLPAPYAPARAMAARAEGSAMLGMRLAGREAAGLETGTSL